MPVGVEVAVETVRVDEPEPPVIEVVLKVACIEEDAPVALRRTVPLKAFLGATVTLKLAAAPAVTVCEPGLTDSVKFAVPLLFDVVSRLGEITHPASERSRSKLTNTVMLRNIYESSHYESYRPASSGYLNSRDHGPLVSDRIGCLGRDFPPFSRLQSF